MNVVDIDVSKGKSMVTVMRPFGEVLVIPFEVSHTDVDLKTMICFLKNLPGETKVVMEYTGKYYQPIAKILNEAGIFVSVVNVLLIYRYENNSIREVKIDRLDVIKITNYCLVRWAELEPYSSSDRIRQTLKACHRQYGQYMKLKVALKNNLIFLLDETFPSINTLFKSAPRKEKGHEKRVDWRDFDAKFWHLQCICTGSYKSFAEKYQRWCSKAGYNFCEQKDKAIYDHAIVQISTFPKAEATKSLIVHAVTETLSAVQ